MAFHSPVKIVAGNRSISNDLSSLRDDMRLTDLTFICHEDGNTSFPSISFTNAHQRIFANLSKTLEVLFSIAQEKQPYERVYVNIDSTNPIILEKLVEYIYEGKTTIDMQQHCQLIEVCKNLQIELPLLNVDVSSLLMQQTSLPSTDATDDIEAPQKASFNKISNQDLYTHWKEASIDLTLPFKEEPVTLENSPNNSYEVENLVDALPHVDKPVSNENVKLPLEANVEADTRSFDKSFDESEPLKVVSKYSKPKYGSVASKDTPNVSKTNRSNSFSAPAYNARKMIEKIPKRNQAINFAIKPLFEAQTNVMQPLNSLSKAQNSYKKLSKHAGFNRIKHTKLASKSNRIGDLIKFEPNMPVKNYSNVVGASNAKKIPNNGPNLKKCKFCELETRYERILKHHVKSVHDKTNQFTCRKCKFSSHSLHDIRRHAKSVHRNFNCSFCKYRAINKRGLDMHLTMLHGQVKSTSKP